MEVLIQADKEADACYIGFGSRTLDAASVAKSLRVSGDLTLDFAADGKLVGLDIMNASKVLGHDYARPRFESLVGVKEAASLARVNRPNFVRDIASRADFPAPVCELATGRIWLRSQVETYLAARSTPGQTPRRRSPSPPTQQSA